MNLKNDLEGYIKENERIFRTAIHEARQIEDCNKSYELQIELLKSGVPTYQRSLQVRSAFQDQIELQQNYHETYKILINGVNYYNYLSLQHLRFLHEMAFNIAMVYSDCI